jgi:GAF domain-containing protein
LPEAVRTGTIVATASAAEAAARYPAVAAERAALGMEAGVGLPLRVGARIIGGLGFIFTAERRFSAEDLAFMGALADLCAQALDRARLYEAEQRARAEAEAAVAQLQTLQAVTDTALAHRIRDDLLPTVLERLMSVLAVDNTALLLPSEDRESLVLHLARGPEEQVAGQVRIPLGQGPAGQIAATRRPLVVDDLAQAEVANPILRTHIRSLLGVPLLVEDRLLGVLEVGSTRPRRFTADDVRFLQLVADRVALALDQARANEALRQAHDRALTALRERDAFLSAAAHELKTPLTSLRGFAQLLLGGPGQGEGGSLDPARTQRALRQIEGQTGKLSLLVDQLLDVARLETGRLPLDRRETDLAALVAEVAAAARAQTDRHSVSVEAPPSAPAWVDPLRLEQVLTNLVGNALK